MNIVGPQMRRLRRQKGWTQDQFAIKMQLLGWDTSRGTVTSLENQQRRVPDLELFLLARILGVKMENLFPRVTPGKLRELYPQYRVKLSRGQIPRPS
ncbi:MAG: helix-turn-helix domain-containing protein [Limisphaerales bacterium]